MRLGKTFRRSYFEPWSTNSSASVLGAIMHRIALFGHRNLCGKFILTKVHLPHGAELKTSLKNAFADEQKKCPKTTYGETDADVEAPKRRHLCSTKRTLCVTHVEHHVFYSYALHTLRVAYSVQNVCYDIPCVMSHNRCYVT